MELKNRKAIIITDEDQSYIPVAVLIVNSDLDIEEVEKEIRKIKTDLAGEWQLSDIIEGISAEFTELGFECVSV